MATMLDAQHGQRVELSAALSARQRQGRSASDLDGWTGADAFKAFDAFLEAYKAKYPKATECLSKDRNELLAFYDFPAENWVHLRTSNVIESTFATIRHRTDRVKGAFSRKSMLSMFKLALCAEQGFRRLKGFTCLAEVIRGVKFVDGVKQDQQLEAA